MDAAKQSIVVTVDDDALHEIHDVAQRLVEKGMAVTRVLPLTGVIVGTCGHAKQDALQRVRGVLSVEPEGGVQSPPPDAPVQ